MKAIDINLFFELFSTNKHLLIFAFGTFIDCSKRKLLTLPNGTQFVCLGSEWVIDNKQVKKV